MSAEAALAAAPFVERALPASDGLTLRLRDYAAGDRPDRAPVLCLPGLTRSARDFAPLAEALAPERRVICLDMRGRGRSDYDPDWRNYNPVTEAADALHVMDALGVPRFAVIGTSRGGIEAIIIAQLRPQALLAVALNDVGPRIERGGLLRLVVQIAATPARFADWPAAVAAMRRGLERQFPALSDAEWMAFARRIWREQDGAPARDFDMGLARATESAVEGDVPELWPQFEALRAVPSLVLRGALSDILTAETTARMAGVHPDLAVVEIADRGHAPFLDEPEAVAAIRTLLRKADEKWTSEPRTPPPSTTTPSAPPPAG